MAEVGPVAQPRSWTEDVNSYRSSVGCKAFSTVRDLSEPVKIISRTVLAPFCATHHPYYSYAEPRYDANERDGSLLRYHRHGWGDVTLLQHGVPGLHRAQAELPSGRMKVADPSHEDMSAMLQCRDTGRPDAWFGNSAIDPAAGKRTVPPPFDPKGRKDLFAVLNQSVPGKPADDFWMGNILIDPARGKRSVPGPEQRLGRQNLFPVIQQNIMREEDRNAKLARGGDGALADSWIGHVQISPAKGKREAGGAVGTEANLIGPVLRGFVPDTDFREGGRRVIEPNQSSGHSHHDAVHQIYASTGPHDDWKGRIKSRRHFAAAPRSRPAGCTERQDLYDIVQFQPVSEVEAARNSHKFMEDARIERKRAVSVPSSALASTGGEMQQRRPGQHRLSSLTQQLNTRSNTDSKRAANRVQWR